MAACTALLSVQRASEADNSCTLYNCTCTTWLWPSTHKYVAKYVLLSQATINRH
jgi:hypothetical protein